MAYPSYGNRRRGHTRSRIYLSGQPSITNKLRRRRLNSITLIPCDEMDAPLSKTVQGRLTGENMLKGEYIVSTLLESYFTVATACRVDHFF